MGRPRIKGEDLPDPAEVVQATEKKRTLKVAWYGGGRRRVEVVSGTGLWYKKGHPLVSLRWIFVHDLTGTHRDEYFFTTDVAMSVATVIERPTLAAGTSKPPFKKSVPTSGSRRRGVGAGTRSCV